MTTPPVTSITDELLAELEQLAGKATPGPWLYEPGSEDEDSAWSMQFPIVTSDSREIIGTEGFYSEKDVDEANAEFVARANPATILALLRHVRELRRDASQSYLRGLQDQKNNFDRAYCSTDCWNICESKTSDGIRAMDAAIDQARSATNEDKQ